MRAPVRAALALLAVAFAAPWASAQTASRGARSAADGPPIEVAAFGHVGSLSLAASKSFDAVLGKTSGAVVGGGGEVAWRRGILRNVFARVDVSRFEEEGQRVFVFGGEVFELGIPLTVTITPVEATGGYRFVRTRGGRPFPLVPYAGLGVGSVQYRERSPGAESGEDVDERFVSYHVLGGLDIAVWRFVTAGAELQYRWVPDALGAGGVSEDFNETNMGGASVRVRVGVRF